MSGSHPETFSNKDIIFASIESRRSLVPSFKGSKRKKNPNKKKLAANNHPAQHR